MEKETFQTFTKKRSSTILLIITILIFTIPIANKVSSYVARSTKYYDDTLHMHIILLSKTVWFITVFIFIFIALSLSGIPLTPIFGLIGVIITMGNE